MIENKIEIPYSPGDALIDVNCYFGVIESLKKYFDTRRFLDLCSGIDAAVLHNHLHFCTFGADQIHEDPLIKSFEAENVLVSRQDVQKMTYGMLTDDDRLQHVFSWGKSASVDNIKDDTKLDIIALNPHLPRFRLLFMLEDLFDLPLVLDFTQTPLYLARPDIQHEEKASELLHKSLYEQYKNLTNELQSIRRQTDGRASFPIPPVALEALNICDNLDDLGSVVLDLRNKYKVIRKRFTELDEIMRSGDVSPMIKMKEQFKINESIKALFKYDDIREISLLTSFGRNLNDMSELTHLLGMPGFSISKWKKLINLIVKRSSSAYWKFRLKPLFSTKKSYLNTSTNKMHAIIKKHFNLNISENTLQYVDSYSHEVRDFFEPGYIPKEEFKIMLDKNNRNWSQQKLKLYKKS